MGPGVLFAAMYIGAATMKKQYVEAPQKIKNRTTIQSRNSTPGYLFKVNVNTNSKRYMQPNVHCSIIHNSQDMHAR